MIAIETASHPVPTQRQLASMLGSTALKLLVAARIELDAAAARETEQCGDAHRSLSRTICCERTARPLWSEWAQVAFQACKLLQFDPVQVYGVARELVPWVGDFEP